MYLCVCIHILRDVTIAQIFKAFLSPLFPLFTFPSSPEMCAGGCTSSFSTFNTLQKIPHVKGCALAATIMQYLSTRTSVEFASPTTPPPALLFLLLFLLLRRRAVIISQRQLILLHL